MDNAQAMDSTKAKLWDTLTELGEVSKMGDSPYCQGIKDAVRIVCVALGWTPGDFIDDELQAKPW